MFSFGDDRVDFNNVVHRGHLTLRHLLLDGWDASWETLPYPPAQGDFAVYDIDELKEKINYAVTNVRLRNNIWHNISFVRSFLPSFHVLLYFVLSFKRYLNLREGHFVLCIYTEFHSQRNSSFNFE